MRTESGERIILCFDRDHTVSVNGKPDHASVPIGWVQYWAHQTEIPVWATGNQHLKAEALIPGIKEAEQAWIDYVADEEYEYQNSQFEDFWKPRRRDGLRLIQDLYESAFSDEDFRFIVVDDVDVSDLAREGPWLHYLPWQFYYHVRHGAAPLEEPPEGSYTNEGVPFNSTDSHPDFETRQRKAIKEIRNESQDHRTDRKYKA